MSCMMILFANVRLVIQNSDLTFNFFNHFWKLLYCAACISRQISCLVRRSPVVENTCTRCHCSLAGVLRPELFPYNVTIENSIPFLK